jgi:serine/threonine-protein kinase
MDKYFKKEEVVNGYSILNVIGQGRYGIAYLAIDKNGKKYVVKQLKKEMLQETRLKLIFEEKVLKSLNSPKFPKFISKFRDKNREGYILEYIDGRVLYDYLSEDGHLFTKEEIYEVAEKLIELVETLQNNNIVHRDIRLPNIIVKENKELVLIDFGLARFIDNKKYIPQEDYWYIADSLIHLYYSSYEGDNSVEKPWFEELDLTKDEVYFLKKLMGIDGEYQEIDQIKNDLQKIKKGKL